MRKFFTQSTLFMCFPWKGEGVAFQRSQHIAIWQYTAASQRVAGAEWGLQEMGIVALDPIPSHLRPEEFL